MFHTANIRFDLTTCILLFIPFCCHQGLFSFAWKTFFSISFSAIILTLNLFFFCLKMIYFTFIFEGHFAGYRLLVGSHFSVFRKYYFTVFLFHCFSSEDICQSNLFLKGSLFFSVQFKFFSLSVVFSSFTF